MEKKQAVFQKEAVHPGFNSGLVMWHLSNLRAKIAASHQGNYTWWQATTDYLTTKLSGWASGDQDVSTLFDVPDPSIAMRPRSPAAEATYGFHRNVHSLYEAGSRCRRPA